MKSSPHTVNSAEDVSLFARQPIFDVNLNIKAYELLFRPPEQTDEKSFLNNDIDGDMATSQVMFSAFTDVDIIEISENNPVFVNFTARWLTESPPIDPKHLVIEILEDIEVTDEVIQNVKRLSKLGYTIALDDFEYSEQWEPLLELADYVKLDVLKLNSKALRQTIQKLSPYKLKLLAEKIEDYEKLKECINLGFEYFQGYFLCRPQNITGKKIPATRLAVMQIITELQSPDTSIKNLENLISKDPTLSYKLLRIINSAAYSTIKKITSLHHAITLLGLEQVKSWITLISLTNLSDKPDALLTTSLIRAKMCETLSQEGSLNDHEKYFTIGLFSLLDAFFDQEMGDILKNLPLTDEVKNALLHHQGIEGKVLSTVEAFEQARWKNIDWDFLEDLNVDESKLKANLMGAIHWSNEITSKIAH
ncbi:MAG: hypothetical protein COB04_05035 [Gammaproteobacteria bacterium]|nr:MAG: hypothetical protein COB04_05035 [Gammaproteobacteria bacterium]